MVHLLDNGVRLKTVPSRLTIAHLQQLLADDGRPAWPPPIQTGPVQPGGPIEVDRLVTANGLITLAGQQHPIGYHLAGRRVTARIRDARPAGPPPTPAPEALRVERRISCRGALVVAGQRIHVGIGHAGRTVTVETADHTFRIYDGDQVLTEVAHTTTKTVAASRSRKPEAPRRRAREVDGSPRMLTWTSSADASSRIWLPAMRELLAWTANNGIPLVRVEFGVPFVETDHGADVWLFYDTDANLARLADISPTVVSEFT